MYQNIFALFIPLLTLNAQLQFLLFHVVCVLCVDQLHTNWRTCKFSVNYTLIQTLSQITLTGVFRHYSVLALVFYLHHIQNEETSLARVHFKCQHQPPTMWNLLPAIILHQLVYIIQNYRLNNERKNIFNLPVITYNIRHLHVSNHICFIYCVVNVECWIRIITISCGVCAVCRWIPHQMKM